MKITNETTFLRDIKFEKKSFINKNNKHLNIYYAIYILINIIIIIIILYLIYGLKKEVNENIKALNSIQNNYAKKFDYIIEPYIKSQKAFCDNPDKYIKQKYENKIFLSNVKFNENFFKMYIYKSPNFILTQLNKYRAFEFDIGNSMIMALKYYALKFNIINNKEIFILDIGGNIGWYPSILGRYNYSIISFEPLEKNYYVSMKNFCYLNKDSNVIIVTKGLGNEEKSCSYFIHNNSEGNGMVLCDNKNFLNNSFLNKTFIKDSTVDITTLNYFMPYLSNKRIALIKIDVEGNELHVLEGGIDLITKYHVPFIILEFSPSFLKEENSDPKSLIKLFVINGYKISIKGFLSKEYITPDELLGKTKYQINCFFIHNSIE